MKLSEENGAESGLSTGRTSNASSKPPPAVVEKPARAMAVKKTRAAPATKAPSKPKTSPRKIKTVPPIPAFPQTTSRTAQPSQTPPDSLGEKRNASMSSQEGKNGPAKTDDMDSLSNGMKKISIKLKVPSAEDYASKQQQQQQKQQDDKPKKPRAPRKPPVPKATKIVKSAPPEGLDKYPPIQPKHAPAEEHKASYPAIPTTTTVGSVVDNPVLRNDTATVSNTNMMEAPVQAWNSKTLGTEVPQNSQPAVEWPQYQDQSIPYPAMAMPPSSVQTNAAATTNGYGYPGSATVEQPQPPSYQMAQTHAETTAAPGQSSTGPTTPTRKTKHDLPVFTSESPIPFAPPPNSLIDPGVTGTEHHVNQQPSIWDLPQTPHQN